VGELVLQSVGKVFPSARGQSDVVALRDVSFTVAHNEFCSVLGHSGCGKTTLLNLVAAFERPSTGRLTIDGEEIRRPNWNKAVVFQEYALFPWCTVRQNVTFGLEMKRLPPPERRRLAERYIHLVGLDGFEDRFPHELSGGMRQRVAVARALAVDPLVLLMDEPFAALDAQTRSLMQEELLRIWERERKTVLMVTHSIEEAVKLSDQIVVLTPRPGTVRSILRVDLPRPRKDTDLDVIRLKEEIGRLIVADFDDVRSPA
jgi:NitT/TauT family transport system ATP-binding protein